MLEWGNYFQGKFYGEGAIFLGGNYPGRNLTWGQLSSNCFIIISSFCNSCFKIKKFYFKTKLYTGTIEVSLPQVIFFSMFFKKVEKICIELYLNKISNKMETEIDSKNKSQIKRIRKPPLLLTQQESSV